MKHSWEIRENSLPIDRKTNVDFPDQPLAFMVNGSISHDVCDMVLSGSSLVVAEWWIQ